MTLVLEKQIGGPTTHAIVIGVGAYAHLIGGGGELFPDHESMGQLTSPPHSARAFTNWLLKKHHNPNKPLASLELLVSDVQGSEFTLPNGEVTKIKSASKANVEEAVWRWIGRGDESRDNLMIFYFCGHGIAGGPETALLLDDFGKRKLAPLNNAIDFRGFWLGMNKCKAREQCYFVDACRRASSTLIESYNYAGDPIIPGTNLPSPLGRRHAPVYYSTVAGESAHSQPGAPSVFTEALLKALDGAGSDDFEGDWRVYTDRLNIGITHLLERLMGDDVRLEQVSPVDALTRFTLHYLDGKPIVPVTIGCRPSGANEAAELSYSYCDGSNKVIRPDAKSSDWDVDIEEGNYRFSAVFPGRIPITYCNKDTECTHVRPACRIIQIEV